MELKKGAETILTILEFAILNDLETPFVNIANNL
jgi:hypothetical protein